MSVKECLPIFVHGIYVSHAVGPSFNADLRFSHMYVIFSFMDPRSVTSLKFLLDCCPDQLLRKGTLSVQHHIESLI